MQGLSGIPIDAAAQAIIEMRDASAPVLHLARPQPIQWKTIAEPIAQRLHLPVVAHNEWFDALVKSSQSAGSEAEAEMMRKNPAVKILDFSRHMPTERRRRLRPWASLAWM